MYISGELVWIFIGCLRIVQRRLGYLPLILKGGYVMMVFLRMLLGFGKRNCKVYKYSDSNNFKSFKQDQQLSNCTFTFKARIYVNCYLCGKEYTSWRGLFYHKRKVHNCTNVYSRQYELELELKYLVKPERKEAPKCMLCFKKIEVHYWKMHRDSFKWIECKISCGRLPCGKV